MNGTGHLAAGALGAGLFVLACSSDATGPTSTQPDLISIFGEMLGVVGISASTLTQGTLSSGMLGMPATPGLTPAACTFSPSAQNFVCTPVTVNGLTFARTYTLYDVAGHPQSHPGVSTASVRLQTTMSGTTTVIPSPYYIGPTGTVTIDRQEDDTLSGINTGHHILNGVSAETTNGTAFENGSTNSFSFTNADTAFNLSLRPAGWPLSGSTRSHSVGTVSSGGVTVPDRVDVVMTFDGSTYASFTVTKNGRTGTCSIDLSNPRMIEICLP